MNNMNNKLDEGNNPTTCFGLEDNNVPSDDFTLDGTSKSAMGTTLFVHRQL